MAWPAPRYIVKVIIMHRYEEKNSFCQTNVDGTTNLQDGTPAGDLGAKISIKKRVDCFKMDLPLHSGTLLGIKHRDAVQMQHGDAGKAAS